MRVIKWCRDGITIEADQGHVREINWNKRITQRLHATWMRKMRTMQEVMEARDRTSVNSDSAKPNTIGIIRLW